MLRSWTCVGGPRDGAVLELLEPRPYVVFPVLDDLPFTAAGPGAREVTFRQVTYHRDRIRHLTVHPCVRNAGVMRVWHAYVLDGMSQEATQRIVSQRPPDVERRVAYYRRPHWWDGVLPWEV